MPDILEKGITVDELKLCYHDDCGSEQVRQCGKCKKLFCVIHSNKFSPSFCQECFKNMSAVSEKFTRNFEDFNMLDNKLTIHKQINTRYYMDGMDWPFVGLWIKNLNDDELRAWWIFHFSVMKLIEQENEIRKVANRNNLMKQSTGLMGKTTTTTTRTTKVIKPVDSADDVRKRLKRQGLPDSVIDLMIKVMRL